MHGCKSHYSLMLQIFFAPLLQFELIEKIPHCGFDYFFPSLGLSEFDSTFLWLLSALGVWTIFEFYHETNKFKFILDFKYEHLMSDLIKMGNFNYLTFLAVLFFVIFSSNFSGLLPYTQTITSQLFFTLIISFITMLLIWGHSFSINKILMFNHFLPNGAPLILLPFIILIEMISNLSRLVSLSVRLFANMTSGHALLKILAGFGLQTLTLPVIWKALIMFPLIIIFIITILEIIIAFLQTYVFLTLTLIYISEQEI